MLNNLAEEEVEGGAAVVGNATPTPPTVPKSSTMEPVVPTPQPPTTSKLAEPTRIISGRRRAATVNAATEVRKDIGTDSAAPHLKPPILVIPGRKETAENVEPTTSPKSTSPKAELPAQQTALPPIVQPRGRSRTVTAGLPPIRDPDAAIPIDQVQSHLKELGSPRAARFTVSVSTTSSKEPEVVFKIVTKVLQEASVVFESTGLVASCKLNDIGFEIEVCRLPNLPVCGLRFKRLQGNVWEYKEVLSSLISKMAL